MGLTTALVLWAAGGCATIPHPTDDRDTLVIVSLQLAPGDGHDAEAQAPAPPGVVLVFKNVSRGGEFEVVTSKAGYAWFPCAGGDSYALVGYHYQIREPSGDLYTLSGRIGAVFDTGPDQVCYLGHYVVHEALLDTTGPLGEDADAPGADPGPGSVSRTEDAAGMVRFLREAERNSAWLSCEAVTPVLREWEQ